jgi:hypothetical protein
MRLWWSTILTVGLLHAGVARATEPWSDADPPAPPTRFTLTPDSHFGFRGAAEYRVNMLSVTPLDLQATSQKNLQIIEQRLRLDGSVDYDDKVHIVASADLLDGVLWGDNGTLGSNHVGPLIPL